MNLYPLYLGTHLTWEIPYQFGIGKWSVSDSNSNVYLYFSFSDFLHKKYFWNIRSSKKNKHYKTRRLFFNSFTYPVIGYVNWISSCSHCKEQRNQFVLKVLRICPIDLISKCYFVFLYHLWASECVNKKVSIS